MRARSTAVVAVADPRRRRLAGHFRIHLSPTGQPGMVKPADRDTGGPAAQPPGRVAQRRRTRNAIVAAAKQLISEGVTPSIDDVAAAADVSRRTIYLYFPTVDQLLLDATVGLLSEATSTKPSTPTVTAMTSSSPRRRVGPSPRASGPRGASARAKNHQTDGRRATRGWCPRGDTAASNGSSGLSNRSAIG